VSEEREKKSTQPENLEPGTDNEEVEAHQKTHGLPVDSTNQDDGDDVEAHQKWGHGIDSTSNDDGDDVEAHVKKDRF
jgi:hypothetical protein